MHPKTYDIKDFPDRATANAQGHTVPLTPKQALELSVMNRKERRAWLKEQRKAGKK